MKEYPVTFNELIGLGGVGIIATIIFSVGGTCLSTWWQLKQQFDFTMDVDKAKAEYWHGVMDIALPLGCALIGIGIIIVCLGGAVVANILRDTDHEA